MRLRQLFEAPGKEISIALGRLNPAHVGHGLLVEALKQSPGDSRLYLTDRPAKLPDDPLAPSEKLAWAQKSFPDIDVKLAKNIFFAASELFKEGYTKITILEGENKLTPLIQKYNGNDGPHGFFNFENIQQKRLSRNSSSEDADGASATKLRKAAIENDFDTFEKNVTKSAKPYAKKMFDTLQGYLGTDPVEEDLQELVVKQQRPKIEVIYNIADRKDNKPFPLSYKDTGGASSGGMVYITPDTARKFIRFYEQRADDEKELMQKALKSVSGVKNLFNNLNLSIDKIDIDKDNNEPKVPKNPLDNLLGDNSGHRNT